MELKPKQMMTSLNPNQFQRHVWQLNVRHGKTSHSSVKTPTWWKLYHKETMNRHYKCHKIKIHYIGGIPIWITYISIDTILLRHTCIMNLKIGDLLRIVQSQLILVYTCLGTHSFSYTIREKMHGIKPCII